MPLDINSTATNRLLTIAGTQEALIALAVNRHTVSYDTSMPLVRWATAAELSFLDGKTDGAWLLETGAVSPGLCQLAGLRADGQLETDAVSDWCDALSRLAAERKAAMPGVAATACRETLHGIDNERHVVFRELGRVLETAARHSEEIPDTWRRLRPAGWPEWIDMM